MTHAIQYNFQRYEKKYFLTAGQRDLLIDKLSGHMCPDEYGSYPIYNIYYDTPDFQLIRRSLDGPIYKEKLRLRSYGDPGGDAPVFLEIKKKFNGVVYKRRTEMEAGAAMDYMAGKEPERSSQICHEIDWFRRRWQPEPKVFLAYDRQALAARDGSELRVTFDTAIRFRREDLDLRLGGRGREILPRDRVLMEIKIPGVAPVWLARLLSEERLFPVSFSKYGYCYMNYLAAPQFICAACGKAAAAHAV